MAAGPRWPGPSLSLDVADLRAVPWFPGHTSPWVIASCSLLTWVSGCGQGAPGLWGLCPLATPPVPFSSLQEILRPYGAFWLTAAFCILSVLFTLTFVPETKGRTLEQITAHFEGR